MDFSSALYLGLSHPSASLAPWAALTLGKPAALAEPPGADALAQRLAALQGCERGTLLSSTLHLFWDLFGMLDKETAVAYVDAGAYAVARWGAEGAAARGLAVRSFPHQNPAALRRRVERELGPGQRPIVVADGFCPGCGAHAPIAAYLQIVRGHDGCLVLDDTQALGLFGERPRPGAPFGQGGGGSLCWSASSGPDVLVGASLAKGFGVPLAVLSGSHSQIQKFRSASKTRIHSSPPSTALIRAAQRALAVNTQTGDALRLSLARRIREFRQQVARHGLRVQGGMSPVQVLRPVAGLDPFRLHRQLARRGIETVPLRACNGGGARLAFLLTVRHRQCDIRRCAAVLGALTARAGTAREAV